ncbi:MAG: hypothetical protein ACD_34C00076G0001, partial [uncultured bacterium]
QENGAQMVKIGLEMTRISQCEGKK